MKFNVKKRVAALGVLLTLVALGFFTWNFVRTDEAEDPVSSGQWVEIETQTVSNELTAIGKVLPARMKEIVSPVSATVSSLNVTWGDRVTQGQALGQLDSVELASQIRAAQVALLRSREQDGPFTDGEQNTELLNAKRRVLNAQSALQGAVIRQRESAVLLDKGFISAKEDESAKFDVINAEQQLLQAQDELKSIARKYSPDQLRATKLEADIKRTDLQQLQEKQKQLALKAPFSGVIIYPQENKSDKPNRELVVGSSVSPGEAILAVGDTSSYLIRLYCSESDFSWLEIGMPAEVMLSALPEQQFLGQIEKLSGLARSNPSTGQFGASEAQFEFLVSLRLDQGLSNVERSKIQIGGAANVKVIQANQQNRDTIPLDAVMWSPDGAAQVRWRADSRSSPQTIPVRIARVGANDVLLRNPLKGEVWVPSSPAREQLQQEGSGLKRIFGFEE